MLAVASLLAVIAAPAVAQRADSARAGIGPAPLDTAALARRARARPPITPRRAFLYSLLAPGYGQSRLDRSVAGALFAGVEFAGVLMLRNSSYALREAKRLEGDSVVALWRTDPATGVSVPVGRLPTYFTPALVRARRLHVEDWYAVLAFNHLFSAADAFVAAQLWDLPTQLSVRDTGNGFALVATVTW